MEQDCFLKENRREWAEKEIALSKGFTEDCEPIKWRIRPMSQKESENLWRRSRGDKQRYETLVISESVLFPDLRNAALQNSYGAIGAERLLTEMLRPGEYERLKQAVEEINGGKGAE